jgi:hypothetical protein
MLEENTLSAFISQVDHTYQQFCVWKYANNQMVVHEERFNTKVNQSWCNTTEELIANNRRFQNFWTVTLPTLMHGWMLSVSRLMDDAYFDPKKKTKPNLSMNYIIDLLNDRFLAAEIAMEVDKHQEFVQNIIDWRHKYLAHSDVSFSNKIVKKGFEDYIECLVRCIEKIKTSDARLKSCTTINLQHIDAVSRMGVAEVFAKL